VLRGTPLPVDSALRRIRTVAMVECPGDERIFATHFTGSPRPHEHHTVHGYESKTWMPGYAYSVELRSGGSFVLMPRHARSYHVAPITKDERDRLAEEYNPKKQKRCSTVPDTFDGGVPWDTFAQAVLRDSGATLDPKGFPRTDPAGLLQHDHNVQTVKMGNYRKKLVSVTAKSVLQGCVAASKVGEAVGGDKTVVAVVAAEVAAKQGWHVDPSTPNTVRTEDGGRVVFEFE
jgi:hypothetical protein